MRDPLAANRDGAIIQKVRVYGVGSDPLLARLRASYLFDTLELRPSRLSPASVLCVRSLRDPRPYTVRLDQSQAFPDRGWQRAVRDQVDALARGAVRPILGAIPADDQAVLFNDRGELLACLAVDWRAGQLATRWWWKGLLRGDLTAAALAMWRESPEFVPAALNHLAEARQALPFLGALPKAETSTILQAVIARYGLVALQAVLDEDEHVQPQSAQPGLRSPSARQASEVPSALQSFKIAAPWRDWLHIEPGHTLDTQSEILLAIALGLVRQPQIIRTVRFAERVRHWLVRVGEPYTADAPSVANIEHDSLNESRFNASGSMDNNREETRAASDEGTPDDAAQTDAQYTDQQILESRITAETHENADLQAVSLLESHPSDEEYGAESDFEPEAAQFEFVTAYGGIFYLLNAALALELYGDFTMPRSPGIALSPWDFLALMGSWFVGDDFPEDPVWKVLASLSGRGESSPGDDFDAPEAWQTPPSWVHSIHEAENEHWHWSADDGRLRIWHPAGFWVIDEALVDTPEAQLLRALEPYALTERPEHGSIPTPSAGRLTRWCDWVMMALRARLYQALEVNHPAALVTTLFTHRAQVLVTAARVDITLDLNTLPIEIRLAGLDRDPGWIPAAGRSVAFHFEV